MAWRLWKICGVVLLLAATSLGVISTAMAQQSDDEMKIVVVRSAEPGCEPVCPEWISAEGEITRRTDDRFREVFRKLGKRRLPVIVHSPGGSVEAAMLIGRMIRERKLDVAIGTTNFRGCKPLEEGCTVNAGRGADYFGTVSLAGAFCNSACPLVLAGGVHRVALPSTSIGLHQVTTTFTKTKVVYQTRYRIVRGKKRVVSKKVVRRENAGSYTTYEMNTSMERRLRAYLTELGVDPNLVERMKATRASELSTLVEPERTTSKLVERNGSLNGLVGPSACKSVPASSNCRLITTDDVKQTGS